MTIEAVFVASAALAAVIVQLTADLKLGASLVGSAVWNLHVPPVAGAVTA